MRLVTINLTTKALIRALQWRRMEVEEKTETAPPKPDSKHRGSGR